MAEFEKRFFLVFVKNSIIAQLKAMNDGLNVATILCSGFNFMIMSVYGFPPDC